MLGAVEAPASESPPSSPAPEAAPGPPQMAATLMGFTTGGLSERKWRACGAKPLWSLTLLLSFWIHAVSADGLCHRLMIVETIDMLRGRAHRLKHEVAP